MRLDAVEIKANVAGTDVAAAVAALDLEDDSAMQIWFYEDLTPGVGPMPLLESGLVLRVRVDERGDADVTVKLRPCRRSQVTETWLATESDGGTELTVEEDRTAANRVLAVSCKVEYDAAAVAAPGGPPYDLADLLSEAQLDFLAACSPLRVNVAELSALGPIAATRWKDVGGDELADLAARAERWSVAGEEFLEVSRRVDFDEADQALDRLHELLAERDVSLDTSTESKTRRVLSLLASASL